MSFMYILHMQQVYLLFIRWELKKICRYFHSFVQFKTTFVAYMKRDFPCVCFVVEMKNCFCLYLSRKLFN